MKKPKRRRTLRDRKRGFQRAELDPSRSAEAPLQPRTFYCDFKKKRMTFRECQECWQELGPSWQDEFYRSRAMCRARYEGEQSDAKGSPEKGQSNRI